MPFFQYQAIDKSGKETADHIEAVSEAEALQLLQKKSLTVLDMKSATEPKAQAATNVVLFAAKKVPTAIVLTFYEQLSFLIKAGIPIFLAIRMLGEQLKHPKLSEILKQVLFELSEGTPLSSSLQKYPDSFPSLHTNLIGVGEKSGNLDAALNQLVELVRESQEIKDKVVKAAAYPIFLLLLSLGLVFGLLLFVFPKFEEIFASFHVKLPAITQFFINASQALRSNTAMIGSVIAVFGFAIVYFFTSESTSEARDKIMLNTPLLKDVFVAMFVALFAKTLSSLLRSGIPLLESLGICQQTIKGELKRKFFDHLITTVKEGEPASRAMEGHLLIPDMALQLFLVGERTGHIDQMLDNTFIYYKKRYNELLTKTTAVLQPLLLLVAAALICCVAISLFVPLFKLSSSMHEGGE